MNFLNNLFGRYLTHPKAVVISCFFNPMNSPYRKKAFDIFYNSIKHLNHRIVECVIGDSEPQLPKTKNISHVYTESLLWHKETLLNNIIKTLPEQFRYVFWVDADVIFTNQSWLCDGVEALATSEIIQPFEYCIHLEQDEMEPLFDVGDYRWDVESGNVNVIRRCKMWRSFCANFVDGNRSNDYDKHGHVGFAWGARRSVLEACPLYDKALIGGADHIIAHAAAEQVPHPCIQKAFKDDIQSVNDWSRKFARVVAGEIGFVAGDLYHIWHGDIDKRQYLQRIKDFTRSTKQINIKDANGLYVSKRVDDQRYLQRYFMNREVLGPGYYSAFDMALDAADALVDVAVMTANALSNDSMVMDQNFDDIPQPVSEPTPDSVPDSGCDCQEGNECSNSQTSENFS